MYVSVLEIETVFDQTTTGEHYVLDWTISQWVD